MPEPLTTTQLLTLQYIESKIKSEAVAPTLQEIADVFEISKAAANERVSAIVEKGWLRRVKNRERGLAIAEGVTVPAVLPRIDPPVLSLVRLGRKIVRDYDRFDRQHLNFETIEGLREAIEPFSKME